MTGPSKIGYVVVLSFPFLLLKRISDYLVTDGFTTENSRERRVTKLSGPWLSGRGKDRRFCTHFTLCSRGRGKPSSFLLSLVSEVRVLFVVDPTPFPRMAAYRNHLRRRSSKSDVQQDSSRSLSRPLRRSRVRTVVVCVRSIRT